ncbi:MAG: hypothetical protein V1918_05250, partial [Planctomycetota bacterium]
MKLMIQSSCSFLVFAQGQDKDLLFLEPIPKGSRHTVEVDDNPSMMIFHGRIAMATKTVQDDGGRIPDALWETI